MSGDFIKTIAEHKQELIKGKIAYYENLKNVGDLILPKVAAARLREIVIKINPTISLIKLSFSNY